MADPTPTPGATPEAGAMPAGVAEAVPNPNGDADLGDGGKRALADLRRELKEVKADRDSLRDAQQAREDAEKSELEKATRDRDEATSKLSAAELKVLKMEAAIDAGIPKQWMRLNGTTPDELKADAKTFAESLGHSSDETPPATPADLGAGPRPGAPATGSAGFSARLREQSRGRR